MLPELYEIKRKRKNLNLSQAQLAKLCNMTQSTISRIENGNIDPPYSKVKIIFEKLNGEKRKKNTSILKSKVVDIMTKDIISISPENKLKEAIVLMNKYNISQLPIFENNHNYGSITSKKAQKLIIENSDLINVKLADLKELSFPEIEKGWNLEHISDLLTKYPAILVKEYNKYIGIITDADFLKLT
jgi:predicted transcriptional regulator